MIGILLRHEPLYKLLWLLLLFLLEVHLLGGRALWLVDLLLVLLLQIAECRDHWRVWAHLGLLHHGAHGCPAAVVSGGGTLTQLHICSAANALVGLNLLTIIYKAIKIRVVLRPRLVHCHLRWLDLLVLRLLNPRIHQLHSILHVQQAVANKHVIVLLRQLLLRISLTSVDYQRSLFQPLDIQIFLFLLFSFTWLPNNLSITFRCRLIGTEWSRPELMQSVFHWMIARGTGLFSFHHDSRLPG